MTTNLQKLQELLGYTGGTLAQMVTITGLTASEILTLNEKPLQIDYKAKASGSVMFTCSGEHILNNKAKEYYGNYSFWYFAIEGLSLEKYI